jgi:hypothetical protein
MYGSEGTDSPVQAEDAPDGATSASKSPSGSGSSASGDNSGGSSGKNLKVGAVAVLVVFGAVIGLRRLTRRS